MADPVLFVDNVSKSFGGLKVTDNVTLTVEPGEVHALIGPNGAGKTTLVSQISGTLRPDAGRIVLGGEDVTNLGIAKRAQRRLGRVFQISNVVTSFTARENVALAAQARSGSSFRLWAPVARESALNDKADHALGTVGLEKRGDVPAGLLAHGEKRALELAMCLVQEPVLLLLDEPMAGAGREETARLTDLLRQFKRKIPMLLVEHDMGTVFALADRVSVLVNGAVIVSGAPDDVRKDPAVRKAYLGGEAT